MSKWISASDLEATMGHKILIAGLQEAGKTAIKRIFFLRQQAVDVNSLKATIDYERMAVKMNDVPITVVDLGGQRIFIRRFLNSFSPFIFNSVKILIFVIDVSLKSTRNNSVQYFASAVQKLKEYSPNAEVYVFLHKNDLIKNSPNYESIHAQIKEQFQVECDQKIKFFRTTIFDESSVVNAFGRIFELSIPKAAKSKFVDERSIDGGEEFSDKFAVDQFKKEEEQTCPFCNIQLFKTPNGYECNICGFIPREKQKMIEAEPIKPMISVDDLKAKLNNVIVKEPHSYADPETIVQKFEEKEKINENNNAKNILTKNFDQNVKKLLELSLNREQLEKILSLEQKKFFNFCLNFGVPLELIRFLINEFVLKHFPKNLRVENHNLVQAISYLKNGYVKDNDFLKFVFFNDKLDNLSIEDIIWNNYPYPFKENIQSEQEIDLEKQPLDPKLILLSFKENIGAKVTIKEYNSDIVFYQGKRKLGMITVPLDVTEKDFKYMLIFELKFPIEGNLQSFVEETAGKLKNYILENKKSTLGYIPPATSRVIPGSKTIENVKLAENKDIFYTIIIENENFDLSFFKMEKFFGKVTGPNSISAPGMYQLIKNETLIPTLISEDDLMFIILELYNKFSQLVK
jgi:hypothetical protein